MQIRSVIKLTSLAYESVRYLKIEFKEVSFVVSSKHEYSDWYTKKGAVNFYYQIFLASIQRTSKYGNMRTILINM